MGNVHSDLDSRQGKEANSAIDPSEPCRVRILAKFPRAGSIMECQLNKFWEAACG